jgi:hypothetical protein
LAAVSHPNRGSHITGGCIRHRHRHGHERNIDETLPTLDGSGGQVGIGRVQPVLLTWVLGGVVLPATAHRPLSKWLIRKLYRQQSEIIAALQPPAINPSRMLILCSRRDEVRAWLRG